MGPCTAVPLPSMSSSMRRVQRLLLLVGLLVVQLAWRRSRICSWTALALGLRLTGCSTYGSALVAHDPPALHRSSWRTTTECGRPPRSWGSCGRCCAWSFCGLSGATAVVGSILGLLSSLPALWRRWWRLCSSTFVLVGCAASKTCGCFRWRATPLSLAGLLASAWRPFVPVGGRLGCCSLCRMWQLMLGCGQRRLICASPPSIPWPCLALPRLWFCRLRWTD
jgi:hypothetical protein